MWQHTVYVSAVRLQQPGDVVPQYHLHPKASTHKISLDLYRRESRKILDIFQRRVTHDETTGERLRYDLTPVVADGWAPSVLKMMETRDDDILFEKASIDESFFDLSVYVRKQLILRYPYLDIRDELRKLSAEERAERCQDELPPVPFHVCEEMTAASWEQLGVWWPEHETQMVAQRKITWVDVAHAIAAERMIAMRKHILDGLGYTTYVFNIDASSAGIANNKSMAKVCGDAYPSCALLTANPAVRHFFFQRWFLDFCPPCRFAKFEIWAASLARKSKVCGRQQLCKISGTFLLPTWRTV